MRRSKRIAKPSDIHTPPEAKCRSRTSYRLLNKLPVISAERYKIAVRFVGYQIETVIYEYGVVAGFQPN